MGENTVYQKIIYTDIHARQIDRLGQKMAAMPFPVPVPNVGQIIVAAILRLSRDLTSGTELSAAQVRRWQALYPDGRGVGGKKTRTFHVNLTPEADAGVNAIGAYLESRFSDRTLPNLKTTRGKLNGQLVCAFAVYYALEVTGEGLD